MQMAIAKAKQIRLLILDVDGVLTNAQLVFDEQGREYKAFHARDGHGIKLLRASGVEVAVISGRKSEAVAFRLRQLGIEHVYQGHEDKLAAFAALLSRLALEPQQVAHVGDDLPDLPLLRRVGLAVAVHDAYATLHEHADWVTSLPGGGGAVREVCDFILHAQGKLQAVLDSYLQ